MTRETRVFHTSLRPAVVISFTPSTCRVSGVKKVAEVVRGVREGLEEGVECSRGAGRIVAGGRRGEGRGRNGKAGGECGGEGKKSKGGKTSYRPEVRVYVRCGRAVRKIEGGEGIEECIEEVRDMGEERREIEVRGREGEGGGSVWICKTT